MPTPVVIGRLYSQISAKSGTQYLYGFACTRRASPPVSPDTIPLISSTGRDLGYVDREWAISNPAHFRCTPNKRGNVTKAIRRTRQLMTVPLSNRGIAFQQALDIGGILWALKGTPGSGKAQAAVA